MNGRSSAKTRMGSHGEGKTAKDPPIVLILVVQLQPMSTDHLVEYLGGIITIDITGVS
jgi:hypothetical protein